MTRALWTAVVLALYAAHQDFWFWHDARPLVWGVLPVGLFYHVAYTLAAALVLLGLVRFCWPTHLDRDSGE